MVLDQQEQSEKLIEEFGRQILVPGINEEGQLNISKKKNLYNWLRCSRYCCISISCSSWSW